MNDSGLPPTVRSRAWRVTLRLLGLAACVGLAALLRPGSAVSASAAPWLEAMTREGGATDVGAMGLLLRRLAHAGLTPAAALAVLQLAVASAILYATARAAVRLLGPWGGPAALIVLLVWPVGRAAVAVLSAESPLALATVCVLLAGLALETTPRRAALWLAAGVAGLVLVHPLALAAAPALAIAPLLLPALPEAEGFDRRLGPRPRPAWLPWLAGLCLGLGAAAVLLPGGELKTLWTHDIAVMRAPEAGLELGRLASWPLLGPVVAWLGQLPVVMLVLVLAAMRRVWRDRGQAQALPVALLVLWLVVLAVAGLPAPGHLDSVAVTAPLVAIVATVQGAALGDRALARTDRRGRMAAWALLLAAVAALLVDGYLQRDDRRNALARTPGVLKQVDVTLPAVLDADDADLLRRFPEPAAILPARSGGARLGSALKVLHPELGHVAFGAAYASRVVLLPARPVHPVDVTFAAIAQPLACTPQHCLARLRGR